MKQEEIKGVLMKTLEDNGIELWETGYDKFYVDPIPLARINKDAECGFLAKQIADLYEPPEEVLLTSDEIAEYHWIYISPASIETTIKLLKAQALKARLYYEPKGDEKGLIDVTKLDMDCKPCIVCVKKMLKAQKRLDDINKEKEIEGIKKDLEWLDGARLYVEKHKQLKPEDRASYMTLLNYSNIEAWRDAIEDGDTPQEGVDMDLSYCD